MYFLSLKRTERRYTDGDGALLAMLAVEEPAQNSGHKLGCLKVSALHLLKVLLVVHCSYMKEPQQLSESSGGETKFRSQNLNHSV